MEAIGIATKAGEPLRSVERVEAIAGRGLAGDRYAEESGEFSDATAGQRDITLIAADARLAQRLAELEFVRFLGNVLS